MSIHFSSIIHRRLDWMTQATDDQDNTRNNLIEWLSQKIDDRGAQIKDLENLIFFLKQKDGLQNSVNHPTTAEIMEIFLDLRRFLSPQDRKNLTLDITGPFNNRYAWRLHGKNSSGDDVSVVLYENDAMDSQPDIDAVHRAKESIKVDEYILELQNYKDDAASLIHRDDQFFVKQGKVGDCYAIATMMGIMELPQMHQKIESMAQITDNEKLRLTFEIDPNQNNLKNPKAQPRALMMHQETLGNILRDPEELKSLKIKGYDVALTGTTLQLDITKEKLKSIINDERSATTNSLIVNILEHFCGNFLARIVTRGENTLMPNTPAQDQVRSQGPRSRRDSITAHNDRQGNYDALVANLLGFKGGKIRKPEKSLALSHILTTLDNKHFYLWRKNINSFTYVSIDHSTVHPSEQTRRHAYVLSHIRIDNKKQLLSVHLKNPWGEEKNLALSPEKLAQLNPAFIEYLPRNAKVPRLPANCRFNQPIEPSKSEVQNPVVP